MFILIFVSESLYLLFYLNIIGLTIFLWAKVPKISDLKNLL